MLGGPARLSFRFLCLTTASVGRRSMANARAMAGSDLLSSDGRGLQRHLDAVDPAAPPRVQLLQSTAPPVSGAGSLAVLDSSFNPPTRAHLHMLSTAAAQLGLSQSLLLLAKQNADKKVVGASLVQRLEMMQLIAAAASPPGSMLCGVTAHPLFVDKAKALRTLCGGECGAEGAPRIALLVGFDTWVRVIDPKYYPPGELEPALTTIFDNVEIIVASRDPASAANLAASGTPLSADEQEATVGELPTAVTRNRLHFLHNEAQYAGISSSEVRKAVASGREDADSLQGLPQCIRAYVAAAGLYRE